ncbi:hypothetical protein [Burkholderia gladioli]|uniref:hypothetical protein n=1 Tax=Burkholderia gladioli TaxID=28095 RepID=UPI002FE09056
MKPKIFKLAGFWLCVGDGIGIGSSPNDAYTHWYVSRILPAQIARPAPMPIIDPLRDVCRGIFL